MPSLSLEIFAGVGVQLSPFDNSSDSFCFTFQEYAGKLPVIDSRYFSCAIWLSQIIPTYAKKLFLGKPSDNF